jgi:hypothetical protein
VTTVDSPEANQVTKLQVEEDAILFGLRDVTEDRDNKGPSFGQRVEELPDDVEMVHAADDSQSAQTRNPFSHETRMNAQQSLSVNLNKMTSNLSSQPLPEPPIFTWLAQTVPPEDPESVFRWREAEESRQVELKEQEAKCLEVFHNVLIVASPENGMPGLSRKTAQSQEDELELGARIYYRNIQDRYPDIEPFLARRLAKANWARANRLASTRGIAEHASQSLRPAQAQHADTTTSKERTTWDWPTLASQGKRRQPDKELADTNSSDNKRGKRRRGSRGPPAQSSQNMVSQESAQTSFDYSLLPSQMPSQNELQPYISLGMDGMQFQGNQDLSLPLEAPSSFERPQYPSLGLDGVQLQENQGPSQFEWQQYSPFDMAGIQFQENYDPLLPAQPMQWLSQYDIPQYSLGSMDDVEFRESYWMQRSVASSPVSSANSPLRDVFEDDSPWPRIFCPVITCEHHIKGFARESDRNQHTLTHFRGDLLCGFCLGLGKSFENIDTLKRHLFSAHRIVQTPPSGGQKSARPTAAMPSLENYGTCSVCSGTFTSAQVFYEHLDDCIMQKVLQNQGYSVETGPHSLSPLQEPISASPRLIWGEKGKQRKISSLPPPPVKLGRETLPLGYFFECYICQRTLFAQRKRDWR